MSDRAAAQHWSVLRNALYGFSTWGLPLALSFVATPVIVGALGHEQYGIYALVLGFIAYSFNFNIGRAVTKYVAEYNRRGEGARVTELFSAALFLNLSIGLVSLLVVYAAAGPLVERVFMIAPVERQKTVAALYLAGLIIFLTMLGQLFHAVLQGIQRFDLYSKIFNVFNLTLIAGNLALAVWGFELLGLLVWNSVVVALSVVAAALAARRLVPDVKLTLRFPASSLRLVFNFSWGVVGYQILSNVFLLFERGWITRRLGAEGLTYYVVPLMLAVYLHGFVSSLTLALFPLASEIGDDRDKLRRLYTRASKFIAFLVVFMAVTLIVESRTFLALWMGPEIAENSANLLVLHTITFGALAIYIIPFVLIESAGYPSFNFLTMAAGLSIGVPLMVALTGQYGNDGAAAARLAAYLLIFLTTPLIEKKIFGRPLFGFWLRNAVFLIAAGLAAAACERLVVVNFSRSWPVFFAAVLAGGVVYCAVLLATGFFTAEDRQLLGRIRAGAGTR